MILKYKLLLKKITKNKNKLEDNAMDIKLLSLGNSMFDGGDNFQGCLIVQPVYKYFQTTTTTNYISSWKSKGLSAESIKPPTTSDNSLTPALSYYGTKTRVKFTGSCLKQSKISYTHGKIVNIYIVYELGASSSHINDPTLKNCLFGAVTLTKNTDIDKYKYSDYGIGFDRRSSFSFPGGGYGQNVLIFGVDMSSSAHVDNNNNKKDILVLGKGPTQGLESTLNAEKMYSIHFAEKIKGFV